MTTNTNTNTKTTIQGINKYSLEGTPTGKTWTIEVTDNQQLLTESIKEQLSNFNSPIYFNDTTSKYWIFDFKIENVWFESVQIDCNNMTMLLNAYN